MTQNFAHQIHVRSNPNRRNDCQSRARLREAADTVLRDIAFVLKVTEHVRSEIEAQEEVQELVPV